MNLESLQITADSESILPLAQELGQGQAYPSPLSTQKLEVSGNGPNINKLIFPPILIQNTQRDGREIQGEDNFLPGEMELVPELTYSISPKGQITRSFNNVKQRVEKNSKSVTENKLNMNVESEIITDLKANYKQSLLKLRICQWNARSFNCTEKSNFAISLEGDMLLIQEVWQKSLFLDQLPYDVVQLTTRKDMRGGGTATLTKPHLKCKKVREFGINKDMSAVKLRLAENMWCWMINIYNYNGSISKMQKLIGKVRSSIPREEWKICCLSGDFNINAKENNQDFKILKSLAKQMGWTIHLPEKETWQKKTKIDYMMTGRLIQVQSHQILNSLSDHVALSWEVTLSQNKETKLLEIPDRRKAEVLTSEIMSNKSNHDAQTCLREFKQRRENESTLMTALSYKSYKNEDLLKILLALDDPSKIGDVVNKYWKEQWEKVEQVRYSVDSKEAYSKLRKVLKYHLYGKRDGAIINSLLDDEGKLIEDKDEIDRQLLRTMKEIQLDETWGWLEKKSFPKLNRLREEETEEIVDLLSNGKALSFDGISDALFRKERTLFTEREIRNPPAFLYKYTTSKLRNIWRCELDSFSTAEDTWAARLIPLNKAFPQIPTRVQLRPILVQSPLVKLMEARFLPKLQSYIIEKLGCEQTGFVPTMGVQVNLYRALERITLRTNQKRPVFGLFIDFCQAYNSVPHTLLFQKLRKYKVLEEDEIDFLEQLYCRYHIKIGDETFRPNKGVAQGSVISPALFNVFISDLAVELKEKADMNLEDVLLYADDVMTICTSMEQMKKCIEVIENWSKRNGMSLNKKKSGIITFTSRKSGKVPMMKMEKTIELKPRLKQNKDPNATDKVTKVHREWVPSREEFCGVPICKEYKYLGTWLTPKLTCGPQIAYIRKKSAYLYSKLYPYLQVASADGRRDMFMSMVMPLFNAATMLLKYECSKSQEDNLIRVRRIIFKQFMGISKRTNTELVEDMIRKDLKVLAVEEKRVAEEKWTARKEGKTSEAHLDLKKKPNGLRGVPKEWCELINSQVKICPLCNQAGKFSDRWHLKYYHQIELPHINRIWREELCPITEIKYRKKIREDGKTKQETISREEIKEKVMPLISKQLQEYYSAIEKAKVGLKIIR